MAASNDHPSRLLALGVLATISGLGWTPPELLAQAAATPIGAEMRINTFTPENQSFPEVAMAGDGSFVVVWESISQDGDGHAVAARRFSPAGTPIGSDFVVNSYTTSVQSQPQILMKGDGSFLVTWRSRDQDGSGFGSYGQQFGPTGARIGDEFRISVETVDDQETASAAVHETGNVLFAWKSDEQDGSSGGIYARVLSASGQMGGEFRINETTAGWQQNVRVAAVPGGFVATWASLNVDSDWRAIVLRRYTPEGVPIGGEQQVNVTEIEHQKHPKIAADHEGRFAVVWESVDQDGDEAAAIGRVYSADATPLSDEVQLNRTTIGDQENLNVAADGRGGFLVVWDGDANAGGSFDEIWARRLLPSGVLGGDEFRVNTNTSNRQVFPAVAGDRRDGRLVVVWHSWVGDGSGTSVAAQRLWLSHLFSDGFESGSEAFWSAGTP